MNSDKQIDVLWKVVNKQGKTIEKLEIEIACLKNDSHPPAFKESQYKELLQRLELVEAWQDNIELIDKGDIN